MFSVIPTPYFNWEKERLKYIFVFFPFIGLVIGGISLLWLKLAYFLDISPLLYAAVASIIPILLTGGIHFDGFMDTVDAACSRADFEKKVEIMKDPHAGAFAVIGAIIYFVLSLGLYDEFFVGGGLTIFLPFVFVISRILSALASINFETSKYSKMLIIFSSKAETFKVNIVLIIYSLTVLIILYNFISVKALGVVILFCVIYFLWVRRFVYKYFGGLNGDLAGFLLVTVELMLTVIVAFGSLL